MTRSRNGGGGSGDGGSRFPRAPGAGLLGTIPTAALDLHGERVAAAERRVRDFVRTQARVAPGQVVHIVTGSGMGSAAGPVLRGRVGELLAGDLSDRVQEHRLDLHRGGWLARLR